MLFWRKKKKESLKQEVLVAEPFIKKEKRAASYSVCGEVLKVIYSDTQINVFFVDSTNLVHQVCSLKPKMYLSENENKVKVKYWWIEGNEDNEGYFDYEIVELHVTHERTKFQVL